MTTAPIYIGNWQNLDIHTATNLFLYGTLQTPSNYSDRLRSQAAYDDLPMITVDGEPVKALTVQLDAVSYMQSGPGEYAHVSDIGFVQDFFAGNLSLGPGTYTREDLIAHYGFTLADFSVSYSQYQINTESSDYAQRAYVFNTTGFAVSKDTIFVIEPNGDKSITQVALLPLDDNFDFNSNGWVAELGNNLLLQPQIDPYNIGRTLDIEFTEESKDAVPRITNYNYSQDQINASNEPIINSALALPDLLDAMGETVSALKNNGTIKYVTDDGAWVIYGSADGEILSGTDLADILIAGDGDDTINASAGNDIIYGDAGGEDQINGGNGNDVADYSNVTGGIEVNYTGPGEATVLKIGTGKVDTLTGIETIIGTDDDDFFRANGNDATFIGGDGNDVIDYSYDPNLVPIVATLDGNGDGSAIDGWGGIQTLYSIENFIGSAYDDTLTLDTVLGGSFDGGDGQDNLYYANSTDALDNVNNRIYQGNQYDEFTGFEHIFSKAAVVLVDTTRSDGYLGGTVTTQNTTEGYISKYSLLDYSLSENAVEFDLYFYDDAYGIHYQRDLYMNATIGSVSQSALLMEAATTLHQATFVSVISMTYLRGSHNGDTVTYVDASSSGTNAFTFYSGRGDDSFDISTAVGNSGIYYSYTGGNDVITSASLLSSIIMGEGISPDDVTISSHSITIAGRGSISLYDDFYPIDLTVTYGGDGTWADDVFSGGAENVYYHGYAGDDVIYGGSVTTEIYGGIGNDQIYAVSGVNILYGDPGDDDFFIGDVSKADIYDQERINTVTLTTVSIDDFVYNFDDGLFSLSFYNFSNDLLTIQDYRYFSNIYFSDTSFISVQDLVAGPLGEYGVTHGMDLIDASVTATSSVTINLLSGSDVYYASSYGDVIHGGAGHDRIMGAWGDDIIYGDSGDDYLDGWGGYNILYGGSGDDELYSSLGISDLYGSIGNDRYYLSSSAYSYISDYHGENAIYIMDVDSTEYSYVFDSGYGFYLYDDSMNEFLFMDDYRYFSSITFSDDVVVNFSTLVGGSGEGDSQGFVATEGDDVIYAANANGPVTLNLLGGDDVYDASFYGDSIHGGDGSDSIYGWSGEDRLWGDAGDDTLYGFGGDDILNGGDGLDYLYGGDGADIFEFAASPASADVDYVGDFSISEGDALDLSDLLTLYDPITDSITDFIQITESSSNSFVFIDRDGLGSNYSAQEIVELGNITGITDVENLIASGNLVIV